MSSPSRHIDRLRCVCFRDPGYGHVLGFRSKLAIAALVGSATRAGCEPSFNLPAASAVGIFLLDAAARSPSRRHSACRRRHTRRPLHQHEPRRLQVLHKPLSSDPRHRIVGVIDPLSTLVAERERQSLGDLICGGKAKGRGVGHTPDGSRLKKPVPSRHQVRPRLIQVDDAVETSPTHPVRTAQTALLVKVRCPPGGFQCPPIVAWCSCLTAARLP